jgi:hypothetical protein
MPAGAKQERGSREHGQRDGSVGRGRPMKAFAAGAALARAGVAERAIPLWIALASLGVALAGSLERMESPIRAADHTLVGAVFGIAIPLFAYACVRRATKGGLGAQTFAVTRQGGHRRAAALGYLAGWAACVALVSAWFALLGVFFSRGAGDPALMADAMTSGRIALLGGLAYVALFGFGAALRRPTFWQFSFLAGDWVLGSTKAAMGAAWPRSQLKTLLGAEPVLGLAQWEAGLALWVVVVGCAAGIAALTRP